MKNFLIIFLFSSITFLSAYLFDQNSIPEFKPLNEALNNEIEIDFPDFIFQDLEGNGHNINRFKGKIVILNFWASWCPPCRIEASLIERTWRAYKNRDLVFIGVNIQDRKEDALSYMREFDITYPNGPDPTGEISIDYGVSGLPVTFFISGQGEVVRRWVGAIQKPMLISAIEEIMP